MSIFNMVDLRHLGFRGPVMVSVTVLGTLYADFHYETPPPAYTSLDHRQHEVVAQTTTTTNTTTSLTPAAATDAECGSVIQSNPPSYRSHVSRSSRRAITSHSSAVDSDVISPPDYGTSIAMSF